MITVKILQLLARSVGIGLALAATMNAQGLQNATQTFAKADIPAIALAKGRNEITSFQYLGTWRLHSKDNWSDRAGLAVDPDHIAVGYNTYDTTPGNAEPAALKAGDERAFFDKMPWQGNHLTIIAVNARAERSQTAIIEVDSDCRMAVHNNGSFIKEVFNNDTIEMGESIYIPVSMEAGENMLTLKLLSQNAQPRFRASIILGREKDFSVAWSEHRGFLDKNIHNTTNPQDVPRLRWNPLLERLVVSASA